MDNPDIIAKSLGGLSYGGIFLLAILSNIVIPIPEEIILLTIGYLTGIGIFSYPVTMAIFVVGMLFSDYILYSLSFHGSRLITRLRKRLQKQGILNHNELYLRKRIKKIIFFSRFLIYLRFIGPVVSGSLKIDRKTFLTYDGLALLIYVNIFMGLGNYFHKQINLISQGIGRFVHYFETIVIIILVIFVLRFIQKNFLKWIKKLSGYIPTVIPGLEMRIEQKKPKAKR